MKTINLRTVKKYSEIDELTPTIVNELIEKIVVHQAQGTGKNKTQQLEIYYNFVGILDMPQMLALPQSVTVDTRQGVGGGVHHQKGWIGENKRNRKVTPIFGMFSIVMNTRHGAGNLSYE